MKLRKSGKWEWIKQVVRTMVPALAFAGIAGTLSGIVVFFFKLAAELLVEKSDELYRLVAAHPVWTPLLLLVAGVLSIVMAGIIKLFPEAKGGGIARSEGAARGLMKFRWYAALCGAIAGSLVGYFAGLPLGTEGPAVLIGTGVGQGVDAMRPSAWKRYLITGGASAGFAVATGAPIAAILFALEEVHRRFSPIILVVSGISVAFGMCVAEALGGVFSFDLRILHIGEMANLPIQYVWLVPIIGVIVGMIAAAFNHFAEKLGKFSDEKLWKIPLTVKLLVLFLGVAGIGLLVPELRGGGAQLIAKIADREIEVWMLAVVLVLKFIFIMYASGVGATGGTFVPLLTLGALSGGILNFIFVEAGLSPEYSRTVVLLSVAAVLAAGMKAPVLSAVFVVESSGSVGNALPLIIVAFSAYFVTELFKVESLNDFTLERQIRNDRKGKVFHLETYWLTVKSGSFAAGKRMSEIMFPPTSVVRFSDEYPLTDEKPRVTKEGNRMIRAGDVLQIETETASRSGTEKELRMITDIHSKLNRWGGPRIGGKDVATKD